MLNTTQQQDFEITGFITNLGAYNDGELRGEWVTFPLSEDEQDALFERLGLNVPGYEEYFFTDWEGNAITESFGEYENIDDLNALAEQLDALEEWEQKTLAACLEAYGGKIDDYIDNLDDYTLYSGQDLQDVAFDLMNECYQMPDYLANYIDYDAFARDLGFDGYTETSFGVIYNC